MCAGILNDQKTVKRNVKVGSIKTIRTVLKLMPSQEMLTYSEAQGFERNVVEDEALSEMMG